MYYQGFSTTNYYAKYTCEGHHGHLVHINSTEKNDALLTFLRHYTSEANVYIDGSRKYNYTDIDYEGEVMTYSNWDSAVPQLTEQCVVLSVKTGTWFLNSCSEYHDYVCEMYWWNSNEMLMWPHYRKSSEFWDIYNNDSNYPKIEQFGTLMCLSIGTPKDNKFSICSKWKIHYF